jgi:hypothetical protein
LWLFFERCELLADIFCTFSASLGRENTWYMFRKLDWFILKNDSAVNLIDVLCEFFLNSFRVKSCNNMPVRFILSVWT